MPNIKDTLIQMTPRQDRPAPYSQPAPVLVPTPRPGERSSKPVPRPERPPLAPAPILPPRPERPAPLPPTRPRPGPLPPQPQPQPRPAPLPPTRPRPGPLPPSKRPELPAAEPPQSDTPIHNTMGAMTGYTVAPFRPTPVAPPPAPSQSEGPVYNTMIRCPMPSLWQSNPDSLRQFYVQGRIPQTRIMTPQSRSGG